MADKPAGEKTEKPTPRRLEKAREEGRIPQSMELPAAFTLIALLGAFVFAGKRLFEWCRYIVIDGLSCRTEFFNSGDSFTEFFGKTFLESITTSMPFYISVLLGGIAASIMMGGVTFSSKTLKWKLEELNVVSGIKRLFSINSVVKLVLSIAKIVIIAIIVINYTRSRLDTISTMQWETIGGILTGISKLLLGAMIRICIALLVMAVLEAAFQKWKYFKDMKMTKQEVKEEMKSQDGSPEVKSKIRQIQFQMASRRMLADVPDANVVVVNPTHVAVALKYDNKTMQAPIVVAKGGDIMCEKIKEIARAHGVPIIRRVSLARTLFSEVEIGRSIPEKLFVAVAEVLAMIYRIKHNR